MNILNLLRKIKYYLESLSFILSRTALSPLFNIKYPLSKKIHLSKHVKIGNNTRIYFKDGTMLVNENTIICNNSKIIVNGAKIQIGKNCQLGEYGIYNVFSDLIIGNNVITADRVSFVTNIHHYNDVATPIKNQPNSSDNIVIGDGTWNGMNATILAGSRIGKNCVVAAHSVVKGVYPDFCVLGGYQHVL